MNDNIRSQLENFDIDELILQYQNKLLSDVLTEGIIETELKILLHSPHVDCKRTYLAFKNLSAFYSSEKTKNTVDKIFCNVLLERDYDADNQSK